MSRGLLTESVKVRVKFKPGAVRVQAERLWARPVWAHEGGGRFELVNIGFDVDLGLLDVVRAEVDGCGDFQVVDVVEPAPRLLTRSVFTLGTPAELIQAAGDVWAEHGATWSEGARGRELVTTWDEGVDLKRVRRTLGMLTPGHPTFELTRVVTPADRTSERLTAVEFALDRTPPPSVTTRYWAADDPYWESIGRGDAEWLAYIQTLAGDDEQIARWLEQGRPDKVVAYLSWLSPGDPSPVPEDQPPGPDGLPPARDSPQAPGREAPGTPGTQGGSSIR